jgi:hypothetical protein
MGRTIPSFRIASVMEKEEWKAFRKALDKEDRKVFDDMFAISILYNSASVYSAKFVRIHPIFMSIIFHHYKQLLRITEELNQMKGKKATLSSTNSTYINSLLSEPINAQTKE